MNRQTFCSALELAANSCRRFAQQFTAESLPDEVRFDLLVGDMRVDDAGLVKLPGGRCLNPEALNALTAERLCRLLWVEGKIPCWINFLFDSYDDEYV